MSDEWSERLFVEFLPSGLSLRVEDKPQDSSLAQRAEPPAKRKKRMACRCRWGDPGQLLGRYLIKASLLGGEPLKPSYHNTRPQAMCCKMVL